MKAATPFCVIFLAVVALARPDDGYTTKFDNVDLKEIVCNPKLLENYFNCVTEKGQCTADGKELKATIPDALKTECSKCNEKQKEGTEYIIGYLFHHKPEMWKELVALFDPNNEYSTKHAEKLEKTPSDYKCD